MIKYALACEAGHEFEGWFGASADFDDQQARGLLECPVCATKSVRKQIMAPAVAGTKKRELSESPEARALLAELLLIHVMMKLLPVAHAFGGRAIDGQFAQIFDESSWLSHG